MKLKKDKATDENKEFRKMQSDVNSLLSDWCYAPIADMLKDLIPIITMYAEETADSIALREIKEEEKTNITLLRTAYLLSKFSEKHASKLVLIKIKYPRLWERMEKNKDGPIPLKEIETYWDSDLTN